MFVTMDGGASWTRMEGGFPTVPVDDLVIHPRDNDLVVGTHGRSIYILDDLTPSSNTTFKPPRRKCSSLVTQPSSFLGSTKATEPKPSSSDTTLNSVRF